jgi:DUF1680 family protein
MIQAEPNPKIEKYMDKLIKIIGSSQQEDGYLYASHQVKWPERMMGDKPYSYVLHSHELYNMGHMYEAAVAYLQATGKDSFLKISEKSAQHINQVFFLGDPNYNDGKPVNQAPGHQEIEIGLMKLYRATGKKLYLDMAKKFLDIRGITFKTDGDGVFSATYAQQHKPVAQQEKAVGHAVRAGYLYSAMAEVDSVLGEDTYSKALNKIWHNIVDTKMHITGGLGAVHGIEGFGPDYVLPNKSAYNETCAAVANVFFNYRMFLKYKDAKYIDVAEISLLNNSLSGVSLDGVTFFYQNPLEVTKNYRQRSKWFGCACCPANISRLIPQVSGYMYTHTDDEIYTVLYGSSHTDIPLKSGMVHIDQKSDYPFEGKISIDVQPEKKQEFTLYLRIPTWAGKKFVPGKLYSYSQPSEPWYVKINNKKISVSPKKGFIALKRLWKEGDKVELYLPMEIKVNQCIKKVEANLDRVAITRGPLVYCAEEKDNQGIVQRFFLEPDDISGVEDEKKFTRGIMKGITAINIPAKELKIKIVQNSKLTMIPYYAWANRGNGSMNVWFGIKEKQAKIDYSKITEKKFHKVTASHTWWDNSVKAIREYNDPESSYDTSIPRWTSWPQKGEKQWVKIDLGKKKKVTRVAVYWYDDRGGVQVPGSWFLESPTTRGDRWKKIEIYNTDQYSSLKDVFNSVQPAKELTTRYIRINMTPQHSKTTVGILSVQIITEEI